MYEFAVMHMKLTLSYGHICFSLNNRVCHLPFFIAGLSRVLRKCKKVTWYVKQILNYSCGNAP